MGYSRHKDLPGNTHGWVQFGRGCNIERRKKITLIVCLECFGFVPDSVEITVVLPNWQWRPLPPASGGSRTASGAKAKSTYPPAPPPPPPPPAKPLPPGLPAQPPKATQSQQPPAFAQAHQGPVQAPQPATGSQPSMLLQQLQPASGGLQERAPAPQVSPEMQERIRKFEIDKEAHYAKNGSRTVGRFGNSTQEWRATVRNVQSRTIAVSTADLAMQLGAAAIQAAGPAGTATTACAAADLCWLARAGTASIQASTGEPASAGRWQLAGESTAAIQAGTGATTGLWWLPRAGTAAMQVATTCEPT